MTIHDMLFCEVHRRLPEGEPVNIPAAIDYEWERLELAGQVKGKRIAIGIGSRGVAQIHVIARCLVSKVRESGGEPFIVPAMGSHGGATAEGQIEVLDSLGVNEQSVGCPIRATMETVQLGHTARSLPVYFDRNAAEADGLIIANRIKVHTDFHGKTESGLIKMLAIGLGKARGAATLHSYGVTGIRDYVPEVAATILHQINFVAGFGVVEDGYHRPVRLQALRSSDLPAGESLLLEHARELMPRLPVDDLDVLIVDVMGKDISGAGMDTNIIGRLWIEGEPEPEAPRIRQIVVLDLTDASHGNAAGIGLANFTTRRLLDKLDFEQTMINTLTSGFLLRGRLPMVFPTDAEAIDAALFTLFRVKPEASDQARVIRIHSTLELETLWVTPNLLDEVRRDPGFVSASAPQVFQFASGSLI